MTGVIVQKNRRNSGACRVIGNDINVWADKEWVQTEGTVMGRSRLSRHSDICVLPPNTTLHIPVEKAARVKPPADLRERCKRILRHRTGKDGRQMASVVSGHSLSLKRIILSSRASRSDLHGALLRGLQVPHLVSSRSRWQHFWGLSSHLPSKGGAANGRKF